MGYIQKNNFNNILYKIDKESLVVHVQKLLFKKYMKNHKIYIYIYIYILQSRGEKNNIRRAHISTQIKKK